MLQTPSRSTTDEPKRYIYRPRGAALELFRCRQREVLVEGPAGTGKTRGVLEKNLAVCDKYPNARVLMLRKTRVSMTDSVLQVLEDDVLVGPFVYVKHGGTKRRFRESYNLRNGSRMVCGGIDHADKFMSSAWDIVTIFEAHEATLEDYEKVLSRIGRSFAVPYSQVICDTNPDRPTHWLNQRANDGKMTRLLSRHEDNPIWHDGTGWTQRGRDYIEGTLGALTGARRERLLHGRWSQSEGVVYDHYDAATHLIDKFPIPKDWRIVRSIDFGYVHPAVCQWWAIDGDGRMYLYRQLVVTGQTVDVFAREIVSLSMGESVEATVCDHDSGDRATLAKCGIPNIPANKEVLHGIQLVQERMRVHGDGKPRLYIVRDSLVRRDPALADKRAPCCLEEEIDGYVWKNKSIKDEPVKEADDSCDCARYACAYTDAPRVQAF